MNNQKITISDLRDVPGIEDETIEKIKLHLLYSNGELCNTGDFPDIKTLTNQVYPSDAVEFMKYNMSEESVDLTITSPPYDNLRKYNKFDFNYKTMLNELYRVTKEGGIVVWVVGDKVQDGSETGSSFKHALYAKEVGFRLHDTMIYYKNNPIPQKGKRYHQHFEYMFVLSKGSPNTFNPIMEDYKYTGVANMKNRGENGELNYRKIERTKTKKVGNVFKYSIGGGITTKDKIAFDHPAIFPEQLAEDHILTWSNENDIIFDPMCGSGTTCKKAFTNGRRFIGVDTSKEYIEDICKPRLKECGWNK